MTSTRIVVIALLFQCGNQPANVQSPPVLASADAGVTSDRAVKLVAAGTDPKSVLAYAFSAQRRTATVSIAMARVAGAQELPTGLSFTFTVVPRPQAAGATFDIRFADVALAFAPNATEQTLAMRDQMVVGVNGLSGHVVASTHGDLGDIELDTSQLKPEARDLIQMMRPALYNLVVQFPSEPVGVGARWTRSEAKHQPHEDTTVTTTFTLVARDAATATLHVEGTNAATTTTTDPRAPAGLIVQRNTSVTYDVVARFDGVSQKVVGDAHSDVVFKVPGRSDQTVSVNITHTVESH